MSGSNDPPWITGRRSRRDAERADVTIRCEIKIGFEQWHYANLRYLSPAGFQLDWPRRLGDVDTVRIRIPGLEALTATVRWREGGRAGCQFATPLSQYVFE